MENDDGVRRKLRRLSDELEVGLRPMRPARAGDRTPLRIRPVAAGLGMAISIAAAVAIFAQLLPSKVDRDRAAARASQSATQSGASAALTNGGRLPFSSDPIPAALFNVQAGPRMIVPCPPPPPDSPPMHGIAIGISMRPPDVAVPSSAQVLTYWQNQTGNPVTNQYGSPKVRFLVTGGDGTLIWDSAAGLAFDQSLRVKNYRTGESDEASLSWDLHGCPDGESKTYPLPAGTYTLRSVWAGDAGGVSEPVSIIIR